jgi:thiol-disulfide isomerase/thioredoxin
MERRSLVTFVVLGAIIMGAALFTWSVYQTREALNSEKPENLNFTRFAATSDAPFTDALGNPVSLRAYRGDIVVVNAWASWSPFAETELPLLNEIAGRFAENKVTVLAVNRSETPPQIEAYLGTLPPLPHLTFIIDSTDALYAYGGGFAMPETLVYDARGELAEHYRGTVDGAALETMLQALIDTR